MMEITPAVKQLLLINVMIYIGTNFFGNTAMFYDLLSLHYFQNLDFRWWQPLTHFFMHAPSPNLSHILFNMFGLFSFGTALEQMWGSKKFVIFYMICGLGAGLIHSLVNYYQFTDALNILVSNGFQKSDIFQILSEGKEYTAWREMLSVSDYKDFMNAYIGTAVGASGAIYGIMVAFAFMMPNAALSLIFLPIPIKAKFFVPIIVAFDLFSGVTGYSIFGGGNIAHFAHVGGAIFGFILVWLWRNNKFQHKRWN